MRYVFIFKRSERRFRVWEMLYIVFYDHMLWMNEVNKFTKKSSISVLAQFVCANMQENLSSVVPTRSDKNQAA